MIKINLGCGPSAIDGWINYDWGLLPLFNKFPWIIRFCVSLGWIDKSYILDWPSFELFDIRNRFKEQSCSVSYVYCSQVLEHFERWEALDISREVFRVLKKNAIFRVSVPDADLLVKLYMLDYKADKFAKNIWGYERQIRPKSIFVRLSRIFIRDHKWLYNIESMSNLLREAGFKKVNVVSFRKGVMPDIEKLDLEDHKATSMYLEAVK